ncbi:hypothetical protein BKA70DRAFT_1527107 [Coprinopsis sp. MPI-PUGE-AT-0042]|nr:hypothetical protein BKA70DRAFT_1527107 [Coprinopsis sp. MPI-PUGE-AT-0042]
MGLSLEKIIDEVARGNSIDLSSLTLQVNVQNFSLAAFEAPVKFLCGWALSKSSVNNLRLLSALTAFQCLQVMMVICKHLGDEQTTTKAVSSLYDNLDTILGCFSSLMLLAPRYCETDTVENCFNSLGSFLTTFVSFEKSDRLANLILSSPVVIKAVLFIWSFPDPNGSLYHGWGGELRGCIIIETMSMVTSNADGIQSLFDQLLDSPRRLSKFCMALCSRTLQLGHASVKPGISPQDVQTAHSRLWLVTEALIVEPTVYLALRKAGYLRSFAITLKTLHTVLNKDQTIELITELLQRSTISIGNPIRALVEIFEPGILPIMLDGLAGSRLYRGEIGQQLVRRLGTFSYHPRLLRVLRDSISDLLPKHKGLLRQQKAIGQNWVHFMTRKINNRRYSQFSRAFHLSIAQSLFPQKAEELDELFQDSGPYYKHNDLFMFLNVRSGAEAQFEMSTLPMLDFDQLRFQGDCPAMEVRVNTIIDEFREGSSPNVILMEMHIAWSMERGIALLIEVTKNEGEWRVGRNVARFQ